MPIQLTTVNESDRDNMERSLNAEITQFQRTIKKDPEISFDYTPEERAKGGLSMLEYQSLVEESTAADLRAIIKENRYIRKDKSASENKAKKEELTVEIQEHLKNAKNLRAQMVEIPKVIERLTRLKSNELSDLRVLTIPNSTSRDEISGLLKRVEERLKNPLPEAEKRILNNLKVKLDNAKTAIDSGKTFNDIKVYAHVAEVAPLQRIIEGAEKRQAEKKEIQEDKGFLSVLSPLSSFTPFRSLKTSRSPSPESSSSTPHNASTPVNSEPTSPASSAPASPASSTSVSPASSASSSPAGSPLSTPRWKTGVLIRSVSAPASFTSVTTDSPVRADKVSIASPAAISVPASPVWKRGVIEDDQGNDERSKGPRRR